MQYEGSKTSGLRTVANENAALKTTDVCGRCSNGRILALQNDRAVAEARALAQGDESVAEV